jgi:hypothetical protein
MPSIRSAGKLFMQFMFQKTDSLRSPHASYHPCARSLARTSFLHWIPTGGDEMQLREPKTEAHALVMESRLEINDKLAYLPSGSFGLSSCSAVVQSRIGAANSLTCHLMLDQAT